MCVPACICVHCVHAMSAEVRRGIRTPGTEVTDGELSDMGA